MNMKLTDRNSWYVEITTTNWKKWTMSNTVRLFHLLNRSTFIKKNGHKGVKIYTQKKTLLNAFCSPFCVRAILLIIFRFACLNSTCILAMELCLLPPCHPMTLLSYIIAFATRKWSKQNLWINQCKMSHLIQLCSFSAKKNEQEKNRKNAFDTLIQPLRLNTSDWTTTVWGEITT